MPRIFGQEIQGRTLWIVLGVIAAGVAVVVYVRSRAAAAGGQETPQEAPPDYGSYGGGGGGGGIPVAAPTQEAADTFTSRLQDIQLRAAEFGLQREKNEALQQEQQFNLGLGVQRAYAGLQEAIYGGQTVLQGRLTEAYKNPKLKVECGKGESSYIDPQTGQYACKKSGKSGLKAVGDTLGNAFLGVIRGAGAGAAAGAQLYTERVASGGFRQFNPRKIPKPAKRSGAGGVGGWTGGWGSLVGPGPL